MRTRYIAIIGFIGLLGVTVVGCSRMSAEQEAEVRQSYGIPADMPMEDLGVVKFRAGIPKRVRLGRGKNCTMTATLLTNGLVQMTFAWESKVKVIDGVKAEFQPERSQFVFRPAAVKGWRICLPQMAQHVAVVMEPTIVP